MGAAKAVAAVTDARDSHGNLGSYTLERSERANSFRSPAKDDSQDQRLTTASPSRDSTSPTDPMVVELLGVASAALCSAEAHADDPRLGATANNLRDLNAASLTSRVSTEVLDPIELCEVNTASWNSTGSKAAWYSQLMSLHDVKEDGAQSQALRDLNGDSWNSRASGIQDPLHLCEVNTASWNSTGSRNPWCSTRGGTSSHIRSVKELMEDVFNHGLANDSTPALEAIAEDPWGLSLPGARSRASCASNHIGLGPLVDQASGDASGPCVASTKVAGMCELQTPLMQPHAPAPRTTVEMGIEGLPAEGHILLAIPLSRLDEVVKLLSSTPMD